MVLVSASSDADGYADLGIPCDRPLPNAPPWQPFIGKEIPAEPLDWRRHQLLSQFDHLAAECGKETGTRSATATTGTPGF